MAMSKNKAAWMGAALLMPLAAPAQAQQSKVEPFVPVAATVTPNLRDMPTVPAWQPGDPIKEIPRRSTSVPAPVPPPKPMVDPLIAQQANRREPDVLSAPVLNFNGGGFSGVNPPDTVGDVGATQYVQMINFNSGSQIRVYDKVTGTLVSGPTALDSLGTGNCAAGLGDPIVLWDQQAQRWFLSEFSSAGNRLCVYVSQTADATGAYFAYQFTAVNFPDYPKYAVWPDAYYVGTNEASPAAYALQRSAMLTGAAAASQRFTAPQLPGFGFEVLLPADWDGATPPPAGVPAVFVRHRDSEAHGAPGGPDTLELFAFHVDFATPANSTFTGPTTVTLAEFDSDLCGLNNFSCLPQPGGGALLDPVQQPVMHRVQYRNRTAHEVIVTAFSVDTTGTNVAGTRWVEMRRIGAGPWTLFQEGTQTAADAVNRWMSSVAMDNSGNIALGYNVTSAAVFPGLRYAGRQSTDTPGTMGAEQVVIAGTASNASTRYGDYSSINVDPVNDCTFWFTGMFNAAGQWSTRVATFRFPNPECVDVPVELLQFSIQ